MFMICVWGVPPSFLGGFRHTPHTFYALPFSICVGVHSKG